MHLYIGNKLYSSWSLRGWLLLAAFDIPFEETIIQLDQPDTASRIRAVSQAGRVPVLIDGEITVWESLAIAEYLNDKFADARIWPHDRAARAHARAISSEMHAGFMALRNACPMNLGKRYARRARGSDVDADVARVEEIWREARTRFGAASGEPFLYGKFSAADAMFAPVATRLDTYDFDVQPDTAAYIDAIKAHPAFVDWRSAALREPWIVPSDEVDEEPVEVLRQHPN